MKRIVLAALAVLCLSPAVANAGGGKWLWQDEGVTITEGEKVPIVAWGSVTLTGTSGVTGEISCKSSGMGTVQNHESVGFMELATNAHTWLISNCETFTICPKTFNINSARISEPGTTEVSLFAGNMNNVGKFVTIQSLDVECFENGVLRESLQYSGSLELPVELGTSSLHPGFIIFSGKLKSTFEVKSEVELSGNLKFLGSEAQEVINKHDPPGTPTRHARRHRHHRSHRH